MANNPQYLSNFNLGGIQLYTNPLYHGYDDQVTQSDGQIIRSVNIDSIPLGAKNKRAGYNTLLDTADGSQVNSLFSWGKSDGTSIFLYRFSGTQLWYYDVGQGTGTAWTPTGNGNFTGTHVGFTVLNDTIIIGDGVGSTRHSTDGINFTNTTLAPPGEFFEQYQNRVFLGGTSSTLFYSVSGDPTNWNLSGTSDSSSFTIPGEGKINSLYKLGDRLHVGKSAGNVFRWDGFSLVDTVTNLSPTSPYSLDGVEDSVLYLNRLGVYISDINSPQIISNPITRYIYNENNTGAAGSIFNTAPGVVHRYDYFCSVGSVRDDLTDEPLDNAVVKYNVIKNEWLTYQFNDKPTAFASYKDNAGNQQLVFGNSTGQVFIIDGTKTTDNGVAIPAVIDLVFDFNAAWFEKDWRWAWLFFNPGCEAQVQIALTDTFTKAAKKWIDLGDAKNGVVKFHFPPNSRSRMLFVRIKESSKTARFTFYGIALSANMVDPG